ncbi:MAG: hypothetical protein OXK78_16875 [Caldilineaceae bacterium]|nr:hypothetical protein [Caldilineaceae bacterium]
MKAKLWIIMLGVAFVMAACGRQKAADLGITPVPTWTSTPQAIEVVDASHSAQLTAEGIVDAYLEYLNDEVPDADAFFNEIYRSFNLAGSEYKRFIDQLDVRSEDDWETEPVTAMLFVLTSVCDVSLSDFRKTIDKVTEFDDTHSEAVIVGGALAVSLISDTVVFALDESKGSDDLGTNCSVFTSASELLNATEEIQEMQTPVPIAVPTATPMVHRFRPGDTARVGDWEVSIAGFVDASSDVRSRGYDPEKGTRQIFLQGVRVKYIGESTGNWDWDLSLTFRTDQRMIPRTNYIDYPGELPDDILVPNGSDEGVICCFDIPEDEELVALRVEESWGEDVVWFDLR